jgi:hypothetical protein
LGKKGCFPLLDIMSPGCGKVYIGYRKRWLELYEVQREAIKVF